MILCVRFPEQSETIRLPVISSEEMPYNRVPIWWRYFPVHSSLTSLSTDPKVILLRATIYSCIYLRTGMQQTITIYCLQKHNSIKDVCLRSENRLVRIPQG